jgi:translation initiation factor 1
MQTTNANNKKIPATSSARIPRAQQIAAAAVSSSKLEATSGVAPSEVETKTAKKASPPGLALEGWGLASYDSSSDDEQGAGPVAVRAKSSAAAKKGGTSKSGGKGKGRAPSKEKYLLPAGKKKQPAAGRESEEDDQFMPGSAAVGIGGGLLSPFDPFADADEDVGRGGGVAAPKDDVVHLRVQQRNGKKTLTTVQGLSAAYNYARILRDLKRELCCSGVVVEDEELGSVIQLQGDHRKAVAAFLVKAGMATKANVKVHGF